MRNFKSPFFSFRHFVRGVANKLENKATKSGTWMMGKVMIWKEWNGKKDVEEVGIRRMIKAPDIKDG